MLYTSLLGRISLIYIYSMLSRTQKIRANNEKNLCAKRRFYKKLQLSSTQIYSSVWRDIIATITQRYKIKKKGQ
ncbi:hypothetical protein CGSMWGv00703Dmash_05518 [Gardnerella greenwoodii 00703Dmash]|uniref:Uncharacterized protein n=1 Tax=Gardnerella greenwoodii 00703Dmash TaxID=698960 RepID=I4M6G5_9BIFI|nr:hypothetical protein CGSMWGv00703Dmash_05518 [Gardnerella greenwoodii 00703Dmash]